MVEQNFESFSGMSNQAGVTTIIITLTLTFKEFCKSLTNTRSVMD